MTTPSTPSSPAAHGAAAADPAVASAPVSCPHCGEPASGRFCSSCGTALAGASCLTCSASLTPGARYCHRCGTPAGSTSASSRGVAGVLPWTVAGLALASLIALVAGQRFGAQPRGGTVDVLDGANAQGSTEIVAPGAAGTTGGPAGPMPRAPDISQMTPEQRAERLYDRIMREHAAGRAEAVQSFMPMAVAAFEALAPLSLDQRYDLGRLGEVGGDVALASAQADTILAQRPTHLLGLILAAKAARLRNDAAAARAFDSRLRAATPTERTIGLPEYLQHRADIDAALGAAGPSAR